MPVHGTDLLCSASHSLRRSEGNQKLQMFHFHNLHHCLFHCVVVVDEVKRLDSDGVVPRKWPIPLYFSRPLCLPSPKSICSWHRGRPTPCCLEGLAIEPTYQPMSVGSPLLKILAFQPPESIINQLFKKIIDPHCPSCQCKPGKNSLHMFAHTN